MRNHYLRPRFYSASTGGAASLKAGVSKPGAIRLRCEFLYVQVIIPARVKTFDC